VETLSTTPLHFSSSGPSLSAISLTVDDDGRKPIELGGEQIHFQQHHSGLFPNKV
jgi:hypothetical protein